MNRELSQGWSGRRPPVAWVLGLGLIGGSWAGALSSRGWRVSAFDQDQASLDIALKWGWIHEGHRTIPQQMKADLVILALPLAVLLVMMDDLSSKISEGAIITDVCSLKTQVCEKAPRFAEQGLFFIGGHPMTGSEKSGFKAANTDLFKGYPYVLTPDENCSKEALDILMKLIKDTGAKVVIRTPQEHDEEVAMVSHLPHIAAVVLAQAMDDQEKRKGLNPLPLAGRSFREMTRVADSSPAMWKDIMLNNKKGLLESLDYFQQRLQDFKHFLEKDEEEGIIQAFIEAQAVRRKLD